MALALYRKYRPATFGELVGQDHVTEPLRTALAGERINHAYLFSGPRGCGKTSSARILARSLNCVDGPTPDPCGECESCIALAPEGPGSVDVIELDAASHGGVDDTRELRDRAFFAPAQSRYRIFIIDEAHMVTTQGFNALLKVVEEPPDHLIFVFATTEPDKVISTIRSRTHHYPFRLMPPGVMRSLLERVCAEEKVQVEPTVYPLLIRAGGGSARDTLSVLDQLLAGASDEGVTYSRAVALLGVSDVALIDDLVDALAAGDGATVYGTVDRLVEAGHDPRRFASDLLDRFRNLILLNAVPDAPRRGLVEPAGDDLTKMHNQAERFGAGTLSRFGEIVHTGLSEMRGATAPRLLLELLCSRMLLPAVSDAEPAVLQRLERMERRMTIAPPTQDSAESATEAETPPKRVFQRASERAEQTADDVGTTSEAGKAGAPGAAREPRGEEPKASSPAANEPVGDTPPAKPPEAVEPERAAEPPKPEEGGSAEPEGAAEPLGGMDVAGIRRVWTEVLQEVAKRNRPTQALLLNATVQDLQDGTLVLSMPTSGLAKQFAQQYRIDFVREALRSVLGGDWHVQCVEAGQQGTRNPARGGQNKSGPAGSAEPSRCGDASNREPEAADRRARGSSEEQPRGRPETPHLNGQAANGQAANGESGGRAVSTHMASDPAGAEQAATGQSSSAQLGDIPPPPEPPQEEPPPPDETPVRDSASAPDAATLQGHAPDGVPSEPREARSSSSHPSPGPARGTEEAAIELFAHELGARRIDG